MCPHALSARLLGKTEEHGDGHPLPDREELRAVFRTCDASSGTVRSGLIAPGVAGGLGPE